MQSFLDRLASADPTPGGGGAAASTGAIGAALLSMAARHSLGKPGDDARLEELRAQLSASEALRARFAELIDADARAFGRFMQAYRLPAGEGAALERRTAAMQAGLREAIDVPLDCARACAEGIRLARRCVEICHRNVAADAAAGALALLGALRICELNVSINAQSLADAAYADAACADAAALLNEAIPLVEGSRNLVLERLGKRKGEKECSATSKLRRGPH